MWSLRCESVGPKYILAAFLYIGKKHEILQSSWPKFTLEFKKREMFSYKSLVVQTTRGAE